jgi:hypothetical protein
MRSSRRGHGTRCLELSASQPPAAARGPTSKAMPFAWASTSAISGREVVAHTPPRIAPALVHLRTAGPSIAAAWFAICGCDVLFPIEPAVYDLVVQMPEGLRRVQVKTTTSMGSTGWQVGISRNPHSVEKGGPRLPYDPDVIDYFLSSMATWRCTSSQVGLSPVGWPSGCERTSSTSSGARLGSLMRLRCGRRRSCRSRREGITLAAVGCRVRPVVGWARRECGRG